ncbi:MAG TPA: DEAD/DEAH box helicase [Dehalococcoidia bacterium]|nr:DEAD/DEAH box helicase [Dehalococcoidia bacterium]
MATSKVVPTSVSGPRAQTRRGAGAARAAEVQRPKSGPTPGHPPPASSPLSGFHPVIQAWFRRRFGAPTDAQAAGWPHIRSGRDVLIAAPTGSGKTLAAFLVAIDQLISGPESAPGMAPSPPAVAMGVPGPASQSPESTVQPPSGPTTTVLYVSPLKALGNDIERNLDAPLAEIEEVAREMGVAIPEIEVAVRTGDTPQAERQALVRRPPDILITTPESLYLMLTAARSRERLRHVRTVIVDEIHALARDKRGSHLSLSLARLDHVVTAAGNPRPQRVGLSATQRPMDAIARFLVGAAPASVASGPHPPSPPSAPCVIVDLGHQRDIELHIEVPPTDLEAVASKEQWGEIYDRLADLIRAHRTTLVFVNTRRLSERVAHNLAERLGEDWVNSHHGSLSRDRRLKVEQRLKDGSLRALVATASLELGIDIGSIDLVCQIGSPRSIATFLQRVGRSGHALGLRPHGRIFPTTRDELVECAALVRAVRAGRLDTIVQPVAPLDILAQQIVAEVSCEDWGEDALFDLFRRADPYRDLKREDFDEIVEMLAEGVGNGAGRSPPLVHRDRINKVLRGRRNARLVALQNGGAIPEIGDFRVVQDPDETPVGTVNEDWAIESMAGDIFLLGSTSWRIKRVESGRGIVRVEDAGGLPPTIPFWLGEAPGRTIELSEEVGRLRRDIIERLTAEAQSRLEALTGDETAARTVATRTVATQTVGEAFRPPAGAPTSKAPASAGAPSDHQPPSPPTLSTQSPDSKVQSPLLAWLQSETGLSALGAAQVVDYIRATHQALGIVPSDTDIVFERFFDEAGGMQLVVHAPFGARINKAYGLTLRKRFCVNFDFELQAAASDDAIVLSLGPQHSFPLEEAFSFVSTRNAEEALRQSILYAPVFPTRWRWNATRALAVLRQSGGRRIPPQLQRMRSDDLLAAVFPEQVGCQENLTGPLTIPDHPIIRQTVWDCMHEAMDIDGLLRVLERIEAGEIRLHARDTIEPSPMAHEILSGKPFTYLDDAPLEERRTRAVTLRRTLPQDARDLGALDPDAIERVRDEAWPAPRNAEEVHDALLSLVAVRPEDAWDWRPGFEELVDTRRAATAFPAVTPSPLAEAPGHRPPSPPTLGAQSPDSKLQSPLLASPQSSEAPASAPDPSGHQPPSPPTLGAQIPNSKVQPQAQPEVWFAAENINLIRLLYPNARIEPPLDLPEGVAFAVEDREQARVRLLRGHTEVLGPVTIADLARRTALGERDVDYGIRQVEASGYVLRGHFTPSRAADHRPPLLSDQTGLAQNPESTLQSPTPEVEFCDRRLLARIHRYTLDSLRREIDPVSAQDFMRFLLRWQHLAPESKLQGKMGVRQAIARLQGFEAAASSWERELLAARVADYRLSWLDELCLAGEVVWGRLTPRKAPANGSGPSPSRVTPVSLALRPRFSHLLAAVRGASGGETPRPRAGAAAEIFDLLQSRGALFFDEIVNLTRRLRTDVERGLRELVAWGLVTADGFQGLRQLTGGVGAAGRSRRVRASLYGPGGIFAGPGPSGRWAILHAPPPDALDIDDLAESIAEVLLQRYGVVFYDLIVRESFTLPWREVLRALRRMEARGNIRGGRFVSGFVGEQYALPEAVDALRRIRREERTGERVWVAATDPMNLAGIVTPGPRVPATPRKAVLFVDGLPSDASDAPLPRVPVPTKLHPLVAARR